MPVSLSLIAFLLGIINKGRYGFVDVDLFRSHFRPVPRELCPRKQLIKSNESHIRMVSSQLRLKLNSEIIQLAEHVLIHHP